MEEWEEKKSEREMDRREGKVKSEGGGTYIRDEWENKKGKYTVPHSHGDKTM